MCPSSSQPASMASGMSGITWCRSPARNIGLQPIATCFVAFGRKHITFVANADLRQCPFFLEQVIAFLEIVPKAYPRAVFVSHNIGPGEPERKNMDGEFFLAMIAGKLCQLMYFLDDRIGQGKTA